MKNFTVQTFLAVLILAVVTFFPVSSFSDIVGVESPASGNKRMQVFDENTWASVAGPFDLTMTGYTVSGAVSITWNSNDLLYYAIVQTVNPPERHLATVDITNGVCTRIGNMNGGYSSLAFNSDNGTLYAMTGAGNQSDAKKLYSVDMLTGATTFLAGPFVFGNFGSVIAYNYDDDMIYFWSIGAMVKIDPNNGYSTSTVAMSGDDVDEVQGAVYLGGGVFSISDLVFQTSTSAFNLTSAGVATLIGPTPYQIRGFGFQDPVLPVELSSFFSSVNLKDVTLNWVTTSETNNSGFEIERSDVKGQTSNVWTKVGSISGNGTSSVSHNYSFTDKNLASGKYSYRLKQIDYNGNFEYFNLSNEVNIGVPSQFSLSQNYPNPFNPSTTINYELPFDSKVALKIFDMSGKEVVTMVNEVKTAGYHSVNFNAAGLSSGIYFYTINANEFTATKKLMLIK